MKPSTMWDDPSGRVRLICADCMPIMRAFEDKEFDAIITDWPYNAGMAYADDPTGDQLTYRRYKQWAGEWLEQAKRVANTVAFTPGISNLAMWMDIEKPLWVAAWHKPAAMGRCVVGFNNWEPILIYGECQSGNDVISAPVKTIPGLDWHPCPKPREWAAGMLKRFLIPGGHALDTFVGSGTLLEAAKFGGWRATGIDRSPTYCAKIKERLAQMSLFDDRKPNAQILLSAE